MTKEKKFSFFLYFLLFLLLLFLFPLNCDPQESSSSVSSSDVTLDENQFAKTTNIIYGNYSLSQKKDSLEIEGYNLIPLNGQEKVYNALFDNLISSSSIDDDTISLIFNFTSLTPLPQGVSIKSVSNQIIFNTKVPSSPVLVTNEYKLVGELNQRESDKLYVGKITNSTKIIFSSALKIKSSKNDKGFNANETIDNSFLKLENTKSKGFFPKISWNKIPCDYYLLLLQEDNIIDLTQNRKRARGFWVIENNIDQILKTIGKDGFGEKKVLNYPDITPLEYYLAPSSFGSYRFKMYAIVGLTKESLTNKLLSPVITYDADFNPFVKKAKKIETLNRTNDIEKILSDYIFSSDEIKFQVDKSFYFNTSGVDDGVLFQDYGYNFQNNKGKLSFPRLDFGNFSESTKSIALIYQDEDNPTWGHGMWIIDKSISSIPIKGGSVTKDNAGNITAMNHASLSGINGVTVIESYYAATPPETGANPLPHSYTFKMIETSLSVNDLNNILDKHKRTKAFDPSDGSGGTSPTTVDGQNVTDRIQSITNFLGKNLLTEKKIRFNYPIKDKPMEFSFSDENVIKNNFLSTSYGYNLENSGGNLDFPSLKFTIPKNTQTFALIYQNNNIPTLGHGIWIVDNNISSIPKQKGNGLKATSIGNLTLGNASLSKTKGVEVIESYLGAIPPIRETNRYTFTLIATTLPKNNLREILKKYVRTSDFDVLTSSSGHAPAEVDGEPLTDRTTSIISEIGENSIESAKITFEYPGVQMLFSFSAQIVTNENLATTYGYNFTSQQGTLDFPALQFRSPNETKSFALIYQDEDNKTWGHGIWVVHKDITSIARQSGSVIAGTPPTLTHASLSGVTGVEVIESYYAASPSSGSHNYKFTLIATDLPNNDLETILQKYARTANFDPNTGAGGIAPSTVNGQTLTDRTSAIITELGNSVIEIEDISFFYPKIDISFTTDNGIIVDENLESAYGYNVASKAGELDFPPLNFIAPTGTESFALIYQDEYNKTWGHGIWIIDKNITSIAKQDGSVTQPTPPALNPTLTHASLSAVTGIEVVESYYAASPPSGSHNYKFTLIATDLPNNDLKTILKKYVRTANFNPNTGIGGIAPSTVDGQTLTDRTAAIISDIGANNISSANISFFYPKIDINFTTDNGVVVDGSLTTAYGYNVTSQEGEVDFPPLNFTAPNGTESFALIYQDENNKTWGHGIWIIDKNITSIAKQDGSVTQPTPPALNPTLTHASLSGVTGVEVIESYYAASPPNGSHNYKFTLIATSLSNSDLKTILQKYVRTANFDPNTGTGGIAPSTVDGQTLTDRTATIMSDIGANSISRKDINFNYPSPSTLNFTVASGVVTGGVLGIDYGYDQNNNDGDLDFPSLTFNAPNGTQSLALIYQDNQNTRWGHGIWLIDKNVTSIPKKDGSVTGSPPTLTHASLSGVTGIEVIESYYAPTPSTAHNYKFTLLATSLSNSDLKTILQKYVRTVDFDPSTGLGGTAPVLVNSQIVSDRTAAIVSEIGSNNIIVSEEVSFDYPSARGN